MHSVPLDVDPDRFDALVEAALDEIPDELARLVHNLAVLVEEEPPEGEPADLLGLYDGVALTQKDSWTAVTQPDRIFLYRRPLLDFCRDEDELADEVRITVVHEVAHHFGIDEERLHELGYG